MKDLFDRHQDRLTPEEDRRVWQALTGARARPSRPWLATAVPSAAALTLVLLYLAPQFRTPGAGDAGRNASAVDVDPRSATDVAPDLASNVPEPLDVPATGPASHRELLPHSEAGKPAGTLSEAEPPASDARTIEDRVGSAVSGNPATRAEDPAQPGSAEAGRLASGSDLAAGIDEAIGNKEVGAGSAGGRVDASHLVDGVAESRRTRDKDESSGIGRGSEETTFRPFAAPDALVTARGAGQGNAFAPPSTPAPAEVSKQTSPYPISVGGNAPVNGEPYDAMFFRNYGVNPFVDPRDDRFATFAVDVDNASYALARSYLLDGNLPPPEAIRVEEFVNAIRYDYPAPRGSMTASGRGIPSEHGTFAIHLDAAPSPFHAGATLVRVGLKGRTIDARDRKPAVLTFVVDVSGSMAREDRLELVKRTLRLLLDEMDPRDEVALVVYGSDARTILPHTSLEERREIERAIDRLQPEGATNAEAGLLEAYRLADAAYQRGCINRVILCSDGVANVGNTGADSILERIRREAGRGIELTAVGFGMGNYNDVLMERLADQGDGNYYYVDDIAEAERVFVENLTGTLQTIARQTKIQVEFDPETVRSYRLLGYENRDVRDRDFRNDAVDAGEVGAGHEVTALFEVKFEDGGRRGDLATVRIRYEDPSTRRVTEEARTLRREDVRRSWRGAEPSFRLAASSAQFAEILRGSYWAKEDGLGPVEDEARAASADLGRPGDARELVDLIGRAERLKPEPGRNPRPDEDR